MLKLSPIRKHVSLVYYSYKSTEEKTSLGRNDLIFPPWVKKIVCEDRYTQANTMIIIEVVEGKSCY